MLTLKVITTNPNNQQETYLFYGERIQHKETETNKSLLNLGDDSPIPPQQIIVGGNVDEKPDSTRFFSMSRVFLYGDGDTPKNLIWILPCSDCYVMQNGKTIDTFSARYL